MMARLVFAGYGGQGVILAGKLLATAAMQLGKAVSHIPSYGVEMRGGTANCSVVVSDKEIPSPLVFAPDIACVLNEPSLTKFGPRVRKGGLIVFNSSLIPDAPCLDDVVSVPVPANDIAEELGSYKVANMVMVGALAARVQELVTLDSLKKALQASVSSGKKNMIELNERALTAGFQALSVQGVA
jgi:2-oxoglutarate ferredoxin oxidoreductase subunit gamma